MLAACSQTGTTFFDAGSADAALTPYTQWTFCGWSDAGCTCTGLLSCAAAAGGHFTALGSSQARVCAKTDSVCVIDYFTETEGGGTAYRCSVPLQALACNDGALTTPGLMNSCETLFACNLLMDTCPADVRPGGPIISCDH
jgi:hypothetical protein